MQMCQELPEIWCTQFRICIWCIQYHNSSMGVACIRIYADNNLSRFVFTFDLK